MGSKDVTILYVDDELNNLISFKAVFRTKYTILTANSGEEAQNILKENEVGIIITDQRMPQMTGVEFLESIIELYPLPSRILLTGYADMNAVIDAVNKGKIFHYLSKPWKEEVLDEAIQRGYAEYKRKVDTIKENKHLNLTAEQLEFLLRQKMLS